MRKKKRWQLIVIIAAIGLTIYNILPTVLYYSKPLGKSIEAPYAEQIAREIEQRVDNMEQESVDWLHSFCKLLEIKPQSIQINSINPSQAGLNFASKNEADKFKRFLPRAGSVISFVPAQLSLVPEEPGLQSHQAVVQRKIPIRLQSGKEVEFFRYTPKNENGAPAPFYREISFDRAAQIGTLVGGQSETSQMIAKIIENPRSPVAWQYAMNIANNILEFAGVLGENSEAMARFAAGFTQSFTKEHSESISGLIKAFDLYREQLRMEKVKLQNRKDMPESEIKQNVKLLEQKETVFVLAENLLKKHTQKFASGQIPWNYDLLTIMLEQQYQKEPAARTLELTVGPQNTFINRILLDWHSDKILLELHPDIIALKNSLSGPARERFNQLIINEIAWISRQSGENIAYRGNELTINLNALQGSQSALVLKLDAVAKIEAAQVAGVIKNDWHPKHNELARENFPVYSYTEYLNLPAAEKKLGLVVYAPSAMNTAPPQGMRNNSIYVIAKGLDRIFKKYQNFHDSEDAALFQQDFEQLKTILMQNGFLDYTARDLPVASEFSQDIIFEKNDFYSNLLKATRENFTVHGSKKFAVLEFSDVEQRILTTNKIETAIQEDLLKWKDNYNAAQVSMDPRSKYEVPCPTVNIFLSNLALSARKYFRGDDRKILHWGLDLSGGKTVQLELRDQNNKVVKNEADIKQGINELYSRVNKMGVSEVNIRQVDNNIVMDFPGSQGLSASELIKASSMFFHIVNEKFTQENPSLADSVSRFLQEIWNEAVVTNRKDVESINAIAWKHLYGTEQGTDTALPKSQAAKTLYENGLRLSEPNEGGITNAFDTESSKIALFRGDDFKDWQGQTHPLLIVFKNYALEGTNLTNVHGAYDPSKGNYLSFEVKGSMTAKSGETITPGEDLYNWTKQFSKEGISGSPYAKFTHGRPWRMAIILNDSIISAPNLEAAIKNSGIITGHFSQREINQLTADLKAGSLSFTPRILSEKNVSPELGQMERDRGITATCVALILVILAMISYYRFAGVVASIAVLFNLIIMWATLQNIQATLTLAGIAGVILTVGMAVDANVLIFERIREEFALSGKIASAVQAGYQKAFSAIFDSNITTIIAALILLHFDSGPIKGFAVTLIIGIASSMFTALFMTRYFFSKWVENPKRKALKMSRMIKATKINFIAKSKYVMFASAVIIIVGGFALFKQRHAIFGMDFTGGFAITLEVEPQEGASYRQIIEKALLNHGATNNDFLVRELNPDNNLRILFGSSMELEGHPFYNLPLSIDDEGAAYAYQSNPRIVWIVNALAAEKLSIAPRNLIQLDKNWTAMSGQISESMRNNAVLGLLLALVCILIYITIRFEFKYAASAMLCLAHDVLISLGIIALLFSCGVPLQIDLHTIAALMTIIGYSLNDTIIIFDRIREDMDTMRKSTYAEVVNHAINITLSRTSLTSLTTLVALLALVTLGGSTIFNFSLVMTIGVVFGTLSSIFIASPLMLFFHNMEIKKHKAVALKSM